MRAVVCRDWCRPEDLVVEDVPEPELTPGGVRVAVDFAGVNFADRLIIGGKYQVKPPLPFTPGYEVAGTVLEVADGVTGARPGDRVMAHVAWGGFAEQVVAPEAFIHRMPDSADTKEMAAFPVAYGTSHLGLKWKAALQPCEVLVVHGAAGGVGLTAVEVGKLLGATVIATAGGAEKLDVAKAHGADFGIDYRSEDVRARVKELTDGRGADVVYDPVGGDIFEASLRSTAPGGRILVVGFASGDVPQVPANLLLVKNLTVIGYWWGAYKEIAPERMRDSFEELMGWYAEGKVRPRVSEVFALEDVAGALAALKDRRVLGKVVLGV